MIVTKLIQHQWKEALRSSFWQKSLVLNILLVLVSLYMITIFASVGFFADEIVKSIYKDKDVIEAFTGLLFYYFTIDLLMRFLMQKLPVISITPYLTLPIKKRTLLHYPLMRTIPGLFNFSALLLIMPFFFKVIIHDKPLVVALCWLITVMSLVFFNNFAAFSLKKYMAKRPLAIVVLLLAVALMFYLDIIGILSFSDGLVNTLGLIGRSPVMLILPLLAACLAYTLAYQMLKRNAYIEDDQKRNQKVSSGFSFLSKYGETGILIQNELRLIFRNKRPKSMIWLSAVFLLYGFFLYEPDHLTNDFYMVFAGILLTSCASFTYGQLSFSWESSFFDGLTVSKISPYTYLKSKFLLFAGFNIIGYILTLPYGFISYKIALINSALFIFNTGFALYLILFFGLFNFKRIDLGKSQFMNYEGTNLMQFLMVIPLFGLPFAVIALLKLFCPPETGYIVLLIIGLLGIIFNDFIIRSLVKLFLRNRYRMAAGYRKR